ncbi:uncharacterized protein METZ01_LOCUS377996 [marine metagenome]|uniref:Integration host factor subunit beta n=1 Tax=marine metagenome TaxID=408172 RepID=A0A382TTS4_9ZZZZ
MGTTTKKELAMTVSRETGCKKNLACDMVDTVFEAMRHSLIKAQRIEIRGFGVFQVKETRPKPAARNPRTGQVIYVPARRKTHFRPGKLLKEELHRPTPLEAENPPSQDGFASYRPNTPPSGEDQL